MTPEQLAHLFNLRERILLQVERTADLAILFYQVGNERMHDTVSVISHDLEDIAMDLDVTTSNIVDTAYQESTDAIVDTLRILLEASGKLKK